MDNEKKMKLLRQSIMAIAIKKYGWSNETFHNYMKKWGYGESLRKLPISALYRLKTKLNDNFRYPDTAWKLDDQGRYMWHLLKSAGWNRRRLQMLLMKKFSKSHWNILTDKEKRQTINTLRGYVKK